ncbi:MAG: hypothetical protein RLZZ528_1750 [Pseudomonadota bacterium]
MDIHREIEAEVATLGEVATAGYFLALRLRGASPLMTFTTFPQAWTDAYMENGYMLRDPITTWALTLGGAIRWSSPFLPDPFGIFREAAAHGLKFGASVATGPIGSLTLLSMARADRELTDAEIARARKIVTALHDRTEPPKSLSAEQKALLAALAAKPAPKDVARALGLTEAEARAATGAICTLLVATSPENAVKRARDLKLI